MHRNLIRQTFKKEPIIIGGIEASLRRLSHYDYWSDKVKHSILVDSGADLISYGMGEHSIIEIADALNSGMDVHDITYIKGTVYKTKSLDNLYDYVELPDYDTICADKRKYAESFYTQYTNTDPFTAKVLVEKWTMSMHCRICGTNIRYIKKTVESRHSVKLNSVYQITAGASAGAASVR